jgi:acetyltransferase-like isoleucine patch superfamily enzyme
VDGRREHGLIVAVHPTAEVSPSAEIGPGTHVWHQAQIRERARLGANCIVSKGVYIDFDVQVGSNVKIQNGAFLYHGCTIEDGVFIGPGVCLTNDKRPRAINADGSLKGNDDWEVGRITVRIGASLGTGSIILPDVTIGRFAMVAAGAVVSKDVPDYGLVVGVPARIVGFVCACGEKIAPDQPTPAVACRRCSTRYQIVDGPSGRECRPL